MPRLFISQQRLDEWIEQEFITLEDDQITLDDGRRFQLVPAVAFQEVVGGTSDPHEVLGRVKTTEQLADLSAEHYRDSVLIGDVAYQVLEGFVGRPLSQ
jgi:hypothetical protein